MADLTGAYAKLNRAKHHLDDFNAAGMQWLADNFADRPPPIAKRFEASDADPAVGVFVYFIDTRPLPTPPIELSLIFGDALTNFRAALDYLAWQLVPEPPTGSRSIQFPASNHPNAYAVEIGRCIPGISATHSTIVQRYQPYMWSTQQGVHPIRRLNRMVGKDKHHSIRLMAATSTHVQAYVPPTFPNFERNHVEFRNEPTDM